MKWLRILAVTAAVLLMLLVNTVLAESQPAELLGTWTMSGMEGEDAFVPEGVSISVTFTETEMEMTVTVFGVAQSQKAPYTVQGNAIIANEDPVTYEMADDVLKLTDQGVTLLFTRVEETAADPGNESAQEQGILGRWTMVSISGDSDIAQMWEMLRGMGAYIDLTITENSMTLEMSVFGQTQAQSTECTVEGNTATSANGASVAVLNGDQLILTEENGQMIFKRK